jgi:ABC-2 type transport system ATP-binding protein
MTDSHDKDRLSRENKVEAPIGGKGQDSSVTIETKGLTKRFDKLVAVDHLSLRISSGTIFGLLGPNGAGKSTAIKMLITLLPPTSGTALVGGFDIVRHAREVRRRVGYVPQLVSADGALTGYDNLLVLARLQGVPKAERKPRIDEALEFLGLTQSADKLVRSYSGGMIRRLEIAQAILHHPQVLFLDEPTVGLDPVARHAVWDHVRDLRRRFDTTIFLTTHYMDEADVLCDQLAVMHFGQVVASGSPSELKAATGNAASLDDVFIHYTGSDIETGGAFRETSRTRRTTRRLG